MKFTSQIYLQCYSNLHSAQGSKQANKTLLEIYQSDDAWQIAQELMLENSHMIHGSQLLSQKLNSSLPAQVNPQVLAQFVLSVQNISNLHWLCLAKLFIHTHQSINDLKIQGSLSIDIKLNILKEIPHAMSQMRIQFGVKSSEYKLQVYQQNQSLILESIQFLTENKTNPSPQIKKLEDLIFQTLQSFTQCDVRLNCEKIASFILECADSDRIANLFEDIFLEQRYPNLDEKVQHFLKINLQNEQKDWIKTFYLNYYTKRDIFATFSLQKLSQVLNTATFMISEQQNEDFRSILSDSYQFWLSLINKMPIEPTRIIQSQQIHQRQALLKSSLIAVFQTLCKHSKLKKCPTNIKYVESCLDIIDLDSEEGIVESKMGNNFQDQFSEMNFNANQIREMSMDLLIKIEEGLKNDPFLYRKLFESLFLLASNQESLEAFQLAIFVVDGMTDCCDELSRPFLSDLIKVILDQKSMQNQYICQRIVILLGKIDKIIVSNVTILPSVFQFFSNSIAYDKLSSLASESFTDLMDQYQIQNFVVDQEFKEKSQTYLNFWFQTIYGKIKAQKVLENITKALVIFIYKFKGPEYYQKFLIMIKNKINEESDQSLKDIYLESVVTGQNWINSRQIKSGQQYLIVFSNFMNEFLDIFMNYCFKANRKPDFTKAIGKINWALKAVSYFTKIEEWLQMIKQIIDKSLFGPEGQVFSVGLTPLITILKSQHITFQHLKAIFQCLQAVLSPITTLFISFHQSKATLDYNFSKYVLQIQNLTVALILKHPQITQSNLINYNPGQIFKFIQDKIFKNKTFWEFQVYKEALIFLHELILSNYQVEQICFEVLGICGRTLESLWIQTQNIFFSVYKKLGINPFLNSLQRLKPEVLAPNPLFVLLKDGLEKSDRKVLKSFVRCL